jgi:hypothetical protein
MDILRIRSWRPIGRLPRGPLLRAMMLEERKATRMVGETLQDCRRFRRSVGGFKIENVSQYLFRKLTKFVSQKVGVSKLQSETNLHSGLIVHGRLSTLNILTLFVNGRHH